MNLLFERLEIENYGMFKDKVTFNFQSSGIHQIFGHDINNKEKRNGIGKSQLFEAIPFALYGEKTKRKIDTLVNKSSKKNLFVSLTFTVNNKTYRIERYRKHWKHKNNLLLFDVNEDKELSLAETKLTQELIEEIIQINYETFMKIVLISVEKSKNFFDLSNEDKHDLLESIIKIDFSEYEKKISAMNTRNNKEYSKFVSEKTSVQSSIDTLKKTAQRILKNYFKEKKEIEKLNLISITEEEKNLFNKHYKSVVNYDIIKSELSTLKKEYDSLSKSLILFKSNVSSIQDRLKNTMIVCPSCKYTWYTNQDQKEMFEKQLNHYNTEIEKIILEIEKIKNKIKDKASELKNNPIIEIDEELKNKYLLYEEQQNNSNIKDIDSWFKRIKITTKQSLKDYYKDIKSKRKSLKMIENKIKYLEKERKIIDFWKEAFDHKNTDGIKAFLRNKFIPTFNTISNNILDIIFDGQMSINFDEKFKEYILYKNVETDYIELSRGEKAKLNLSMSFALLEIINMNLVKTNILFLDEIFSGIDSDTIEKFIDIIRTTYLNRGVYIISHERGIDSALESDSVIEIVKVSDFESKFLEV